MRRGDIQGHPERMRKVNYVADVFIFTKFNFHTCSWKENGDKLLLNSIQISQKGFVASLKDCTSNVGCVKIRLQELKNLELAVTSAPSMDPASPYFG